MSNYTKSKGFSLIELMIVIAIIGILAAVAVPSYKNYMFKANVANILSFATPYQRMVEEHMTVTGVQDCYNLPFNLQHPSGQGNGSGNIPVDSIPLLYGAQIGGDLPCWIFLDGADAPNWDDDYTFLLIPALNNGSITWSCQYIGVPDELTPPKPCVPHL